MGEGTQCIIQGLGALGVAFFYSWNLTLVILCTVPLIYLVQAFIARRLSIRASEQEDKLQTALRYITNAIQSIETVKCFNGERYELKVFADITALAATIYMRVANLRSLQIGVMQFFTLSVFVQGFWYGTHLVRQGDRSVGQVITTFWAALMAIQGITAFLPQFIVMQKGRSAGAHLGLLMHQISASDRNHEMDGTLKPIRCPGDIEFRQVCHPYNHFCDNLAEYVGYVLISNSYGGDCDQKYLLILPGRRDNFCHWKEWIRQEYSWSASCAVLPAYIRKHPTGQSSS